MAELVGTAGYSQNSALKLIGLAPSVWHYRVYRRPSTTTAPVPHADRAYPNRLTDEETSEITALIDLAWQQGASVEFAHTCSWDEGIMIGSLRSWYRIAEAMPQEHRPTAPRSGTASTASTASRARREPPVVLATAPMQAWVWDITDLPSQYRSVAFKAYLVQDLFSRKIVAHRVENREVDALAAEMFETAFAIEGAPGTVHADSGAAMKSNAVKNVYTEHGVIESHSRPRVSNDNAHKESEFRTMKKRPHYPGFFTSLDHARAWVDDYVVWFNTTHRHSGIARFTPNQVHDGTWHAQHEVRSEALDAYYAKHPERFRSKPTVKTPKDLVGINLHHRNRQKTG